MTISEPRASQLDNYYARGWAPLPIRPRGKAPYSNAWPQRVYTREDFGPNDNIGIKLGEPSGHLTDADSDWTEAAELASDYLPPTDAIFGRDGSPGSHRLYVAAGAKTTKHSAKFVGRAKGMVVELRSTDSQTVFPGSIHPSGEAIRWERDGEPATVDAAELDTCARKLAAAAVLLHAWRQAEGKRHEAALAIAGGLARSGWTAAEIDAFVLPVLQRADDEIEDRRRTIRDTVARVESGDNVVQWGKARELLGADNVKAIRKFLGPLLRNADRSADHPYAIDRNRLVRVEHDKSGDEVRHVLANFSAQIAVELVRDDGVEQTRVLVIEAQTRSGAATCEVKADLFDRMGWVIDGLGVGAVVNPNCGSHARAAMQYLSDPARRCVFEHTGWRDGRYLHAGCDDVELGDGLDRYLLPAPVEGAELRDVVRSSLALLDVGPDLVMLPLVAAVYLPPLLAADFSLFLLGLTGAGKSVAAALVQAHYGAAMADGDSLPGAWTSTANALEMQSFRLKDALFTIDDYKPGTGASFDLEQKAERLFRAQGNRSGRARLSRDTSLRAPKPPRGLVLATGEDLPRGQSIRARLVILELGIDDLAQASKGHPGSGRWPRVTDAQRDARAGKYAAALAGYLAWLAPQLDERREHAQRIALDTRDRLGASCSHARTPTELGKLFAAWSMFLAFAQDVGAIEDAAVLLKRGHDVFDRLAQLQSERVQEADPAARFVDLLRSALATGLAHVVNAGSSPCDEIALGDPRSKQIGWLAGDRVYLDPSAALAVARDLALKSGGTLDGSERAIGAALHRQGLLAVDQDDEGLRYRVPRRVRGSRPRVFDMPADVLGTGSTGSGTGTPDPAILSFRAS